MAKRHWASVIRRLPKAARTTSDGLTFDSAGEKARWHQLQMMERTGLIRDLRRQVKFPLVLPDGTPIKIKSHRYPNGRRCSYRADFAYVETDTGAARVEDYKGHDDNAARLRRAVVEAIHKIDIVLTGPAARGRR